MSLSLATQPVIIVGMHRSGTTMVARLLNRLGLFVGSRLQRDHESTYFLRANDTLLKRVHAEWDHPGPLRQFLEHETAVDITTQCLEQDLQSWRFLEFLGWSNYLRCRSITRFDRPWGWKDPRTMVTLPLWLKVFRGARIIHVVRNGVDVANSLVVRAQKLMVRREQRFHKSASRPRWKSLLERAGFKGSIRCMTLQGSFSLWEEYLSQVDETFSWIDNELKTIRFEDFVRNPIGHLAELAQFCNLDNSLSEVREAVRMVDPTRSCAFLDNPHLRTFYESVQDNRWMAQFGYSLSTEFSDLSAVE